MEESNPDPFDDEKRIAELEKRLTHQEQLLIEREEKLTELYDQIQRRRISRRLQRWLRPLGRPYQSLIRRIRGRRLHKEQDRLEQRLKAKDPVFPADTPLVSLIILNRNGITYLQELLDSISEHTLYPNYEILLVDNHSTDDSVRYILSRNDTRIRLLELQVNMSFSSANNAAVAEANGSILVFMNNDMIALRGWLCELLEVFYSGKSATVGAVGSILLYPGDPKISGHLHVQHAGIGFRQEDDFIRPVNQDAGALFVHADYGRAIEKIALTGACLLVSRPAFTEAGGFDEKYLYGFEDVDLCLKLSQKGYRNYVAGNSILYHHESRTQNSAPGISVRLRRAFNQEVFKRKWQTFLETSELNFRQ